MKNLTLTLRQIKYFAFILSFQDGVIIRDINEKELRMKLVIITNSNTCRLYHYEKSLPQLTLTKEIVHPENKLKISEQFSDRQGHYQGGESARGAYQAPHDPKEIEFNNFAREIANLLNQERIKKDYDELILIAPPKMKGLLFQHLNKNVVGLIVNDIDKDLINLSDHELLKFLSTHTKYPHQV